MSLAAVRHDPGRAPKGPFRAQPPGRPGVERVRYVSKRKLTGGRVAARLPAILVPTFPDGGASSRKIHTSTWRDIRPASV